MQTPRKSGFGGDFQSIPVECELMKKMNMTKLAKNLFSYSNIGTVYIAAPSSEWDKINEVAILARQNFGYKIIYGEILEEVMLSNYGECEWLLNWKGEILSLVEQAIMRSAEEFIHWPSSSWSGRVRDLRKMFKMKNIGEMTTINLLEQSCN